MISLVRWFSVSAERVSSTSWGSSSTSRILLGLAIIPTLDQRKGKVEGSTATHAALRPSVPSVALDNTPDGGQPDAGALELLHAMQPLEHPKKLIYVLHFEANPVVADEVDGLVLLYSTADLDLGSLAGARVLEGVGEEVLPDQVQQRRVPANLRQFFDPPIDVPPVRVRL